MTDERPSIGQTLRQRREERGLTLEQASAQSRVPVRLGHALESDDYHLLPDALYLIRLLRDYALFLQLDPAPLEEEFRQAVRHPPKLSLAPPTAMRTNPAIPWKQVVWTAAAVLVITPLVFIALSLASKRASERVEERAVHVDAQPTADAEREVDGPQAKQFLAGTDPPPDPAVPPVPTGTSASAPAIPGPGPAHVAPGPPPSSAARAPSEREARRHTLVVRARELTWVAVRVDGGEPREALLQAGQVARFTAEGVFRITVGNAGGVTLLYDGIPVPVGGRSGDVIRDLVLPVPAGGRLESGGAGAPDRLSQP